MRSSESSARRLKGIQCLRVSIDSSRESWTRRRNIHFDVKGFGRSLFFGKVVSLCTGLEETKELIKLESGVESAVVTGVEPVDIEEGSGECDEMEVSFSFFKNWEREGKEKHGNGVKDRGSTVLTARFRKKIVLHE